MLLLDRMVVPDCRAGTNPEEEPTSADVLRRGHHDCESSRIRGWPRLAPAGMSPIRGTSAAKADDTVQRSSTYPHVSHRPRQMVVHPDRRKPGLLSRQGPFAHVLPG